MFNSINLFKLDDRKILDSKHCLHTEIRANFIKIGYQQQSFTCQFESSLHQLILPASSSCESIYSLNVLKS